MAGATDGAYRVEHRGDADGGTAAIGLHPERLGPTSASAAREKFPCSSGVTPTAKVQQRVKYSGTSQVYGGVSPSPRLGRSNA